MNILVLYQDIQSGAKIATESMVSAYRRLYPDDQLIEYKQQAHRYMGRFSFVRNSVWSILNFLHVLNSTRNIDVIYSAFFTFALSWRLSKIKNVPAIFHIHGDQQFKSIPQKQSVLKIWYHGFVGRIVSYLQGYACTRATRVAFVSTRARSEILSPIHHDIFPKSFLLQNGVDRSRFHPINRTDKIKLQRQHGTYPSVHIAYIGRIDAKKGIYNLLLSLKYVHTSVTLWVVYPKPTDNYSRHYLRQLRHLATKTAPRHTIKFLQNPKSIYRIYHYIDYLVLPSQQEMMPLVILEALACGVLPLATNVGDVGEVLTQVSDTLLLSSASEKTIARSLRSIMEINKNRRARLIAKGIAVAKKYSWDASAIILHRELIATQCR